VNYTVLLFYCYILNSFYLSSLIIQSSLSWA